MSNVSTRIRGICLGIAGSALLSLAFGAVASRPWRARAAEAVLTGAPADGETFSINRKLGIGFDNNWLWTRGRHTVNFGFEIRRSYQDDHECQDCGGSFTFSAHSTSDGINFNDTGSSFASFLLGTPDSAFRHFAFETKLRNFYIAPYVQDNIKITPKLTVDVGLRWDIARPFTTDAVKGQPANQIVFFDPKAPNPGAISNSTGNNRLTAGPANEITARCQRGLLINSSGEPVGIAVPASVALRPTESISVGSCPAMRT